MNRAPVRRSYSSLSANKSYDDIWNIFRVTGPLCGEFTGPGEFPAQRPVTLSFDVFFDLSLNKRLSKQSWGWWFEMPPWSLWCQCNEHWSSCSNVWASYQIRKIAGCACAGNAGNVSPRRRFQRNPIVGDPGMHHGTCVTHVPWCMSGSLTCGDGENVPGIPGACAPAILRIWQKAHCVHPHKSSWNTTKQYTSKPFPYFTGQTGCLLSTMSLINGFTVWWWRRQVVCGI